MLREPRHESWFTPRLTPCSESMPSHELPPTPERFTPAAEPGGNLDLVYYRLHGSPRTYYSNYEDDFLAMLAAKIRPEKNRLGHLRQHGSVACLCQRTLPAENDPGSCRQ